MHLANGEKINIVPSTALTKDVPVQYGQLVIVPNTNIAKDSLGTARYKGLFDGPIKAGDEPAFAGEPAYFDAADKSFTKTAPESGVTVPVGVFIDNAVLLTGELIPVEATAE